MTVADIRSLFISGPKKEVECLMNDLQPWLLSSTTSPGFKYVSSKDDIEIFIEEYHDCDNFLILRTGPILPQDSKSTPIPINEDVLLELYKAIKNQIENKPGNVWISITLSDNDLSN